jgi:hypothetical protein
MMSIPSAGVVAMAVLIAIPTAAQPRMILVAQSGSKCLTASGSRLVGAACSGEPAQTVTPNFAVGGLQIGGNCLQRAGTALTLVACHAGDAAQVFELSSTTGELANAQGARACADLTGAPGMWRPNQPIEIAPCSGRISQKWLIGSTATSPPPKGTARENDAAHELHSGDYIDLRNGRYLVVK